MAFYYTVINRSRNKIWINVGDNPICIDVCDELQNIPFEVGFSNLLRLEERGYIDIVGESEIKTYVPKKIIPKEISRWEIMDV